MEISIGTRNKANVVVGEGDDKKEFKATFLHPAINNEGPVNGFLINQNSGDLFFLEQINWLIEMKATMESIQKFFDIFATGSDIGMASSYPVIASPALKQQASDIKAEITELIKKIP